MAKVLKNYHITVEVSEKGLKTLALWGKWEDAVALDGPEEGSIAESRTDYNGVLTADGLATFAKTRLEQLI